MKALIALGVVCMLQVAAANAVEAPPLESGDIIFQSSSSNQSYAIMWASKSLYSHVGVIDVEGNKKYVIEAVATVRRTPLDAWIKRGRMGRYAVFRYKDLADSKKQQIIGAAKDLIGRKYDLFFTSHNDEIYCSELVDLAFQKAGVPIGERQKIKDLDVDNLVVRNIAKKRWRGHPLCQDKKMTFEDCWARIQEDEVMTPIALTKDTHLVKIWSNYPVKL